MGKKAHFCQILQGAVSDYQKLISSGLFPGQRPHLTESNKLVGNEIKIGDATSRRITPDIYSRKHWRVQYILNEFWNQWVKEVLMTLQSQQKWNSAKPKVVDIVLLKEKAERNR